MRKVLVVEDNFANQKLVSSILMKIGVDAEVVENGRVAVERFENASLAFDLILMDLQMPEMDGYEATKLIREIEQTQKRPRTKIIALTAHAMSSDKDRCMAAGMETYITKPIEVGSFIQTMKEELNI